MTDKNQYNLVNPEAIPDYLARFSNKNAELARLLCIALEKPLRKRGENLSLLSALPAGAPAWLAGKWETGGPWHVFDPKKDIRLAGKVSHITDWIKAALVNNQDWLARTDDRGRPLKLLKIGTLEQAQREADKAMEKARQHCRVEDDSGHVHKVMAFSGGFRIVMLLDPEALDRESACLGHCIGNGGYDDLVHGGRYRYYSLRDPRNMPHVTMEVDGETGLLLQCKGKQNAPPVEKYVPYVRAFAQKYGLYPEKPMETGLLYDKGRYYDLYNLPSNLDISTDIFLDETKRDMKFPENLSLKGSLTFSYWKKPVKLPRRLSITGDLYLGDFKELLTLPEQLNVTGDVMLHHNRHIETMPDDCRIGGILDLSNCVNLRRLPDSLRNFTGYLDLSGCLKLEKLPNEINVSGNLNKTSRCFLNLNGCVSLTALPKRLYVEGPLHLFSCRSLKTLPDNMVVQGKIFTDYGIFDTTDEFRRAFAAQQSEER